MSWLSNVWDHYSGANAAADAQAAAKAQQAQQFAQQQALASQQQGFLQNQLDAAKSDDARRAAEATAAQERKGGAIKGIDDVFAKFDEPYYQNYAQTYAGAQTPELQHQYDLTKDKLTATLAGKGTLNSSVGAFQFGELDRANRNAQSAISSEAQDAADALRTKVSGAKTQLYGDVYGGADPNQISSRAATDATSLANVGAVAPPPSQSVSDLFGGVLAPFANATTASLNSPIIAKKAAGTFAPLTGTGSSSVVG